MTLPHLPEPGIGFARAGDKTGALTNRQCKKCGGRCFVKQELYHCERCGPQQQQR